MKKKDYTIRKNITLTETALDLFDDAGMTNLSGYINELLIDNLGDRNFLFKRLIKQLTTLQKQFRNINFELEFEINKSKKKIKVTLKPVKPTETTKRSDKI